MHYKIVIAAATLITMGGSAVAAVGEAGATAHAPPLCQASQLRPHYERGDGAMGQHFDTWQLFNTGTRCETRGWVGGLNFGPDGRPLRTKIGRTSGPSKTIILDPGQHASWTFGYTNPAIGNCAGENAVAMIITPPDNVSPVLADRGEPACQGDIHFETPLRFGG